MASSIYTHTISKLGPIRNLEYTIKIGSQYIEDYIEDFGHINKNTDFTIDVSFDTITNAPYPTYSLFAVLISDGYTDTVRYKNRKSPFNVAKYNNITSSKRTFAISSDTHHEYTFTVTMDNHNIYAGLKEKDRVYFKIGFLVAEDHNPNGSGGIMPSGLSVAYGDDKYSTSEIYTPVALNSITYQDNYEDNYYGVFGDYIQGYCIPKVAFNTTNITNARTSSTININGTITSHYFRVYDENDTVIYEMSASTTGNISRTINAVSNISGTYKVSIWLEDNYGIGGETTGSFTVLPYHIPEINLFETVRYEEVLSQTGIEYVESDDSDTVWINLNCSIAPIKSMNNWTLTLTAIQDEDEEHGVSSIIMSGTDGEDISRTKDRTILTDSYSADSNYKFVLVLEDNIGNTTAVAYIYKADGYFNVEKFGVSVGMRTKATPEDKRFEVAEDYTTHLYGPISMHGDISNIRSGVVSFSASTSAGSYKDSNITFDPPFKADTIPVVVVGFSTNSTAGTFGRCCAAALQSSITNAGCTLRFYNGDSSGRNPLLQWIAFGVPEDPD